MGYREMILADSPAAYWRLGELTGMSAADETGNGRTGTYTGTYTLGRTGAIASSADAAVLVAGGYVDVAAAPATAYPLTLEAWCKLTDTSSGDRVVLAVCNRDGVEEWWLSYFNGAFRAVAQASGGGVARITTASPAQTFDTNWHHLVGVFTDSLTQAIYFDGEALAAGAVGSAATPSGANAAFVGALLYNTSNQYGALAGTVDEAAVYAYALTAVQVRRHYSEGLAAAGLKRPWVG